MFTTFAGVAIPPKNPSATDRIPVLTSPPENIPERPGLFLGNRAVPSGLGPPLPVPFVRRPLLESFSLLR